jgi:hypothetical protein
MDTCASWASWISEFIGLNLLERRSIAFIGLVAGEPCQ